ncbi:TetR family transcriptional regulator [Marivirga tractuosa]|uniref:Regulatory protein TetR n=1 Tax=Marivirga tractuosa (strain ATCC 23168 / DSM 4126 / NBRC 15989 / NCIMB 1408 / VKM B-1430 / H-43) TaxID=643867 RepID=E4TPZ4_MARTH|nr:TetR/AcrR family transcriptional regulator [Marivirga tractuosa]ADR20551.1 regulatory protein TetR [Marivirga tractuosa DSM 4126]BDD15001.1 TetR family transcriptional regulator [Marivirga tractuosa]
MSTEKNILEGAKNLFMQFGLKSITMDDIARKVGVSKKTIYQFFNDKNSIVFKSVHEHFSDHRKEIENVLENSKDAIESIYRISKCMKVQIEAINPTVLYDLQRYFPKAYKRFLEFKNTFMKDRMSQIIENGISTGYFRKEINTEILIIQRIEQVQLAFNNEVFPRDKFDFKEVHEQLFDHFIHGILTEKGKEKYNQYLNEEHEA